MQPVKAYPDSNGQLHRTVEEWQKAQLIILLEEEHKPANPNSGEVLSFSAEEMARILLAQSDALVAILTTGPRSRLTARKKAGTTNPKRAVKRATPAQAEAGFARMRHAVNGGGVDPSLAAGTDTPAESAEAVAAGAD